MKVRPLHDWAIIHVTDAEESTSGGIIIPDSAKTKPAEGIVLAIGPGVFKLEKGKEKEKKKKFIPTSVTPGQKVVFPKYSLVEVEVSGSTVHMVREADILGTMEKKDEIAVRERRPLVVKEHHAPTVRKAESHQVPMVKETTKPSPASAPKKPVAAKATAKKKSKTAAKKEIAAAKKTAAAKGIKKDAAANKASFRNATKNSPPKKQSEKNAAPKKTAATKSVPKKQAKKTAVKKAAPKKSAPKRGR